MVAEVEAARAERREEGVVGLHTGDLRHLGEADVKRQERDLARVGERAGRRRGRDGGLRTGLALFAGEPSIAWYLRLLEGGP